MPAARVDEASIESAVSEYYRRALAEHGATPRGVDWPSSESQELRFRVLLEGIDWRSSPSVLDYGCGYGALATHLDERGISCRYVGYDLAPSMIESARRTSGHRDDRRFTADVQTLERADYVVASGIFNVKLDSPVPAWERYVERTLASLAAHARRRFAFNMLPPASPPELARTELYYADAATVVRRCEAQFGETVSLRESYGLWEFTVNVSVDGDNG